MINIPKRIRDIIMMTKWPRLIEMHELIYCLDINQLKVIIIINKLTKKQELIAYLDIHQHQAIIITNK